MSEQERIEYQQSERRLRCANYRHTHDRERMCRVCQDQILVSNHGIRACRMNIAFVTCGGTCDYFILEDPKPSSTSDQGGNSKASEEGSTEAWSKPCSRRDSENSQTHAGTRCRALSFISPWCFGTRKESPLGVTLWGGFLWSYFPEISQAPFSNTTHVWHIW